MIGWLLAATALGQAPPEDTVMVIVAALDLPVGTVIDEIDLYAVQIPPRYLPAGVFLSPDHVTGREVVAPIFANELIHTSWLSPNPARTPRANTPEGWHVLPLRVDVREAGTHHDLAPAGRDCALVRDVVGVWEDPAAVAVRPDDLAAVLGVLDQPLRLLPISPERADCG